MKGLRIYPVERAAKVRRMRATSPAASFFTGGGVGRLWIGKASPLASDSSSKGGGSYNVLGSHDVVGPNVSCR